MNTDKLPGKVGVLPTQVVTILGRTIHTRHTWVPIIMANHRHAGQVVHACLPGTKGNFNYGEDFLFGGFGPCKPGDCWCGGGVPGCCGLRPSGAGEEEEETLGRLDGEALDRYPPL